jgi:superfamily II DNA or RNA helicase
VLGHFHDHAKVIGVTATPDRGDKRNLGEYFQNIAFEVSLLDLVRDGWLCPIRVKTVPLGIDLRGVRTTAGDYNVDDLGHALDPWLDRIADVLAEHRHRKTIVFLPLVALSKSFSERCRQRGMAAAHVDGMSPDRADILDRFRRDELRLLTNAMLLSEGYDEPSIDCVVNLRPTKVRSLFCQILGRGTRIHPGKDHLLVLDFLFQAGEHKLIRPAHLIARDEVHAQELIEALGEEGDLEEAEEKAEADRTRKLVDRLRNNRHRRATEVDALELAVALHENALADFVPEVPWHEDPPTAKQFQILKRFGIDPDTVTCKGHASILLDRLFMRRQLNLATPKQVRLLRRMGVPNAETIGFEEAHEILSARFNPA